MEKMQMLDQKIRKFQEFVNDFAKEFDAGRLSSNMWRSQQENLIRQNGELTEKNRLVQEETDKILSANGRLKEQGQKELAQAKSDVLILLAKAQAKYKEVEKLLDESETKRIKAHLKEMSVMAA